jgi:hypothetical protein
MYVPSETTIIGDTSTVVKLYTQAYGQPTPSTTRAIFQANSDSTHDITFHGFEIDGNAVHKKLVSGNDHLNMIQLLGSSNVTVYDMTFKNGLGDAIKIRDGKNIKIFDNKIDKIGHDGVYLTGVTGAEVHDNFISCRNNAGVRLVNSNTVDVHDNEITSENHGGAGIEIQKSTDNRMNVEIYNNKIYHIRDSGIWAYGYKSSTSKSSDINIRDNEVTDCGLHRGGGVTIQGMNGCVDGNTITDNNRYDVGIEFLDINTYTADNSKEKPQGSGYVVTLVGNTIGSDVVNELSSTHSVEYAETSEKETDQDPDNSITVSSCDGKNDQVEINAAIEQTSVYGGGIVLLPARTYWLSAPIVMRSNVCLWGEKGTIIKLINHADWDTFVPLISGNNCENIEVSGFEMDTNSDNNQDVASKTDNGKAWGNGFYNAIHFKNCINVEVHDMVLHDGLGDGLRAVYCTNVYFYDNTAYKLGHDVLFVIDSENIEACDNRITTRTNSALRFWNSAHLRFHDNTMDAQLDSVGGGPLIQGEDSRGVVSDVEICNNIMINSWWSGIWLISYDRGGNTVQAVDIHHNMFLNQGQSYNIASTGAITLTGMKGTDIHNNVFDGAYNKAVNGIGGTGTTITDNIFTNTVPHPGKAQSGTGYAIYAADFNVFSKVDSNCFWDNSNGDMFGCSCTNADYKDPKEHETTSGWVWNGKSWECDGVESRELSEIIKEVDPSEEIVDNDTHEIYDILYLLGLEYPENAVTRQTAEDLRYFVKNDDLTERGKVAATVEIIGWNNLTKIDDGFYVTSPNDAIVYSRVIRNPSLDMWSGGIKKIEETSTVTIENGIAIVVMNIEATWYNIKTNPITGTRKKSRLKTSEYEFEGTYYPAPKILEQPEKIHGTVYQYPTYYMLTVQKTGLKDVTYKTDNSTAKHIFMVGITNETESGVKYTEYSRLDYWEEGGARIHTGEWISLQGRYSPENISVDASSPYKTYKDVEFEVIEKKLQEDGELIKWWVYPEVILNLSLCFGIMIIYYRIKQM